MQKENFIHILRSTHTNNILTLFHKLIVIVIVIVIVIDIDIVIVIIISLQRDAKSISNLNKFQNVLNNFSTLSYNGYHNIFQKYVI